PQVLAHRGGEDVRVLGEHHHALADLPAGQRGQVVTVELDPARQRVQQAGQGGQQARSPGPRCTGDAQPGAGAAGQAPVAAPRGVGGRPGSAADGAEVGAVGVDGDRPGGGGGGVGGRGAGAVGRRRQGALAGAGGGRLGAGVLGGGGRQGGGGLEGGQRQQQ